MKALPTEIDARMGPSPLPRGWGGGCRPSLYRRNTSADVPPGLSLHVYEALSESTDYLLERFETKVEGPLGRPQVQALPESLADGISVVSFDEGDDSILTAHIDLVRRAWMLDVVVSGDVAEIHQVEQVFAAMLELLARVGPR